MRRERQLFEVLKEVAPRIGKLALPHYGKIESETKMLHLDGKEHPSPVTWLDKSLQELLLAELIRNDFLDVAFNGEEDTELKHFFELPVTDHLTVHCDPIDGTRAFASGVGKFGVGFALSRPIKGGLEFFASVIYDPLDDHLYWSFEDEISTQVRSPSIDSQLFQKRISWVDSSKKATDLGFVLADGSNAHLSIVDVALGRASGYLFGNMQVHDAMVPYHFASHHGAVLYTQNGRVKNPFQLVVKKNAFERIPSVRYYASQQIANQIEPLVK